MKNLKTKKLILVVSLSLMTITTAQAQWMVTDPITDALTAIQAANAFAQRALAYEQQILQYETMIKNLEANPLGAILPNFQALISNAIKIQQNGVQIANGMSQVGANLEKAFKTPQANFGMQFNAWTSASQNAVKAAMLNAGIQRDNLQPNGTDATRLQALVSKNMASGGSLAGLQTLGEFAAEQLQESQKLRDLISAQQIATNTILMQQTSKDQLQQTKVLAIHGDGTAQAPAAGSPIGGL